MGLAGILSAASGTGSLLPIIEQSFARAEIKKPLTPKDYLRASGIPMLCAREEVLCSKNQITRPNDIDAGLNLTFLNGTALHWAVQNKLLGPMGVLYGTWQCEDCAKLYGVRPKDATDLQWALPMPKVCSAKGCKSIEFKYVEPAFVDHDLRLTGHTDGFLTIPGLPGMGILEIKSVGPRYAREVKVAPQIGHLVQAHIYMMFSGLRWAKIFYWLKAEAGMSMLQEHHVDRDEEIITRVQDLIRSIWSGIETGELPERICANATCPRAKACPVTEKCFEA